VMVDRIRSIQETLVVIRSEIAATRGDALEMCSLKERKCKYEAKLDELQLM